MIDWVDGDVNDEGDVARQVEGEVEGEVHGEDEGQVEGEVQGEVEGEDKGQVEVGTEMEEGHCAGEAEVGTEMEKEEVEVHDVNDFELEDVEEDENEDDHVDEAKDEAEDEIEDEAEDEAEDEIGDDGQDEDVDEFVSEESLVDVTIECDIGTSKGNVREEQPFSPVATILPLNGDCGTSKCRSAKRTMSGRPKKKRRLKAWELKKNDTELRKGGNKKTCALCKELGHNKKSCPQRPTTPDVPSPTTDVPVDQPTQQTQLTIPPPTEVPIT
ncbi:hypothetical protein LR48_Vigan05g051400 [Vigna angularis]|uniref:CCHC-type domain-containing protein n=1 Tax=Phaseolus angularis TaxID=3914 RepID=A0A0L9UJ36_PHAAN|nr:hypothetical protein LR48_Vigan05g051400 [Vigna angularis]